MTPSRDHMQRITRLRELFLDESRGPQPLGDYWRQVADLQAYDEVLGARIGWKWDAVLAECAARGWENAARGGESAAAPTVLDYGCGSGIAARRFVAHFAAGEVWFHDRSVRAMDYATAQLREAAPAVRTKVVRDVSNLRPDVLLVSHVLGELDAAGEAQLRELIARSQRVLIVEPGNRAIARRLSTLRDDLLADFRIVAPCTHTAGCPALVASNDWCHFFAPPPPEVFTNSDWVRTARDLGIDLRSLPYSFVAGVRRSVGEAVAEPEVPRARVLGRPTVAPRTADVSVCDAAGLRTVRIEKRREPGTWRALKKDPETVRLLPHEAPTSSAEPDDAAD
ncbi:MAG: methyltransferase domain-containing protein [Planctomycetes bacterium]|jgi:SAM-dependent methyltransferase|nr:methyltransferase domain-containing protein [Planctomycetota bacterium]MCC7064243.1 methyltransferase domain-containing protein [Planctomycetota bacterium]